MTLPKKIHFLLNLIKQKNEDEIIDSLDKFCIEIINTGIISNSDLLKICKYKNKKK